MRVFFPFAYYYPERCAGIYIADDLMHALADSGIDSYMSVPSPTRNLPKDAKWERTEKSVDGRITIHRFRMFKEGKNSLIRALRYFFCEIAQLHSLLWKKYEVVFIDSTPPIQGLKLVVLRWFRKKKVIFNIHDLFPDSLVATGMAQKNGLLWRIGSWVMKVTYRRVDKIITISEDIRKSLVARGVPEDKIEVVYNWVDAEAIRPVDKENNTLYEEFGLQRDKFTVVYAGNLGNSQNIDVILDAASRLTDVRFVIFGTGGNEEEIKERITSEKIDNVTMLPLQPVERVSEVYSLGDACIVSCKPGFGGSAMPSKTWSIMACGRPVIASFDEGELKDIVEKNDCGSFAHAGNADELVKAIKELAQDHARCSEMGKNARKFVMDNLTKEIGTKRYIDILFSVVKR